MMMSLAGSPSEWTRCRMGRDSRVMTFELER